MANEHGFTLLEFVIVIILLSIISVASIQIIATGFNAFLTANNITDADWQGNVALERMTRDIRSVRSPSDISTATSGQFTFTDSTGSSVDYQLSGTSLLRNSLILADGVSGLTFAYSDKNGTTTATTTAIRYITITLDILKNNASFSLKTSVYPRNLP